MFERNLGIKLFMYLMFGLLGLQLFSLGFILDKMLLEIGSYQLAIYTFNSFALYLFLLDYIVKYIFKQNQSMQIAPYLCLPVKRNRLFNFLLVKEFTNVWNLYLLILIVPFAFKSITPYYGLSIAFLYIIFFYSLCIGNSLLVSLSNNLLNKNGWYFFLPIVVIAAIVALGYFSVVDWGICTVQIGEWLLDGNPLIWLVQAFIFYGLWIANQKTMLGELYRGMEGEKVEKIISFTRISFLDRFGEIGEFINLELKMLIRTRRLRSQVIIGILFIAYYFLIVAYGSEDGAAKSPFIQLFFSIFAIGAIGFSLSQFLFSAQSAFFDGLMTRNHSLLNMIKGKYILYSTHSLFTTCLMMIPVYHGKVSFLFVVSAFFYTIGFLFFLMFLAAIYNKSPLDLFDRGTFNWKGTSGNTMFINMLAMFIPVSIVLAINAVFSQVAGCYFMLITGLIFTLTANHWIKWTYKRFLKRRYKNMEGFRSNA
ncbi:hypothetical protein FACS1894169_05470 [Bacteroidia bacterium]|nr:hypothetical protein FACS1894169_05470 [Bacteroidia bacterium]